VLGLDHQNTRYCALLVCQQFILDGIWILGYRGWDREMRGRMNLILCLGNGKGK
jgi:hypothetical protein